MSAEEPITPNDVDFVSVKSSKKTEYKVLCCGNSALDLLLIPLATIGVYILTGVLFALCTHAVIQTTDTDTALWMFFGIYVLCVAMLGLVLVVIEYDKEQTKKFANAEETV